MECIVFSTQLVRQCIIEIKSRQKETASNENFLNQILMLWEASQEQSEKTI